MKFKGIRKREEGKFITRYDVAYETADQKEKIYEIISRSKALDSIEALNGSTPDSVVIIATMRAVRDCWSTGSSAWLWETGYTISRQG